MEIYYAKAKATIETLVTNMVRTVISPMFYSRYSQVTIENTIKLLIRAIKLYEIRN